MEDHLFRVRKAEKVYNLWKTSLLLVLASVVVYIWMGYLGLGTTPLAPAAVQATGVEYEQYKYWFILGRGVYALLFAAFILFIPSLIIYAFTGIPYQKLVMMQQIVLAVLLLERMLWVPLAVFIGLEWYVSPWSFGIIASYITEINWFVYFFGAISLFQLWIVWFQIRYVGGFQVIRKRSLWLIIILLHILLWSLAATTAVVDTRILSGWFE
ncbi:hypothetical protein [Virgibacillus kimchii]